MPKQPYFAVLNDLPKAELLGGVFQRTAIVADAALIQAVWVEPHHPPAPIDKHPYDQTVVVLSGTLELILNGEDRYVLTAGCCLYIPSDVTHQATVLGDEPLHALDVFAPAPENYLPLASHQLDREGAVGDSAVHLGTDEGKTRQVTANIVREGIYGDPANQPPIGSTDHALWLVHWHLALEAAESIAELGNLYRDDIAWEMHFPGVDIEYAGKQSVLEHYTELFQATSDFEDVTHDVFATPTRVFIDQSISYKISPDAGDFMDASVVPPGGRVQGRLLHTFQVEDGLIARETAYFIPSGPPAL
jgi:mannose-6-phosphate isomerase-like protein (cupin superfamily)